MCLWLRVLITEMECSQGMLEIIKHNIGNLKDQAQLCQMANVVEIFKQSIGGTNHLSLSGWHKNNWVIFRSVLQIERRCTWYVWNGGEGFHKKMWNLASFFSFSCFYCSYNFGIAPIDEVIYLLIVLHNLKHKMTRAGIKRCPKKEERTTSNYDTLNSK